MRSFDGPRCRGTSSFFPLGRSGHISLLGLRWIRGHPSQVLSVERDLDLDRKTAEFFATCCFVLADDVFTG